MLLWTCEKRNEQKKNADSVNLWTYIQNGPTYICMDLHTATAGPFP